MQGGRTVADDDQGILEALNDAVYTVDVKGRIQFCNAALEQLTGYGMSHLRGRPVTDFYTPKDRPIMLERRLRAFHGESVPPLLEATLVRSDGTHLPVELSVTNLMHGGDVVGRLAVVRNISSRRRAETALQASEERFRLLVEGVQDYAIYQLDIEGRVASWNAGAERIKGYRAKEILGQSFSRFFPPEEQARGTPASLLEQAARDGHYVGEGWRVRQDGSRFWASVVITALYSAKGQLHAFAKVTRDITERREADRALAEANETLERRVAERTAALEALNMQLEASLQEKEVLLKEIHHRVKNNLQIMSSLLFLQSQGVDDPHILAFLQESERRILSMALVHETLYQTADLAHFNLAQYIPTLSDQLVRAYGVHAGRIAVHIEVQEVTLPLDMAVPCGLILNELLSNCLKHAFPGGQAGNVTMTLAKETDHVILTVTDDGCGFPEHLDFRNTESLGLQLVCVLTEQLWGTISLARNAGTTFTLAFPLPNSRRDEKSSADTQGGNPF
jgi:PAS domain S-box-containing protein